MSFFFFFDRKFDAEFLYGPNVTPLIIYPPARHPVLWYFWFEKSIKKALKKWKVDCFFSPDGHLCLGTDVPTYITIHDLAYKHFPGMIPKIALRYYQHYLPKFAKKARHIITVSNFVRNDIMTSFGTDPKKITTIYNAATAGHGLIDEHFITKIRMKYSFGKPYFFYAGAIHPRKNIQKLIQAYEHFRNHNDCDFPLLLAGRKAWLNETLEGYHKKSVYREDIIFLGRLDQDLLCQMMASAYTFCYLSKMEGFGIPLVEAMQCHLPIICSNRGSLPEICGDAGLIVDPDHISEISHAMSKMVFDQTTYNHLVKKSKERKGLFSWDRASKSISDLLFN